MWLFVDSTNYCTLAKQGLKLRGDLRRQVEWLKRRCPTAEVITDIGSGLNFKRKGLRSIRDEIIDEWQNVGDVIDYIIVATIPEKAPKDVHDDGSARIL